MKSELQIMSEYIDGELPSDIKAQVEERIGSDIVLQDNLNALRNISLPLPIKDISLSIASEKIWSNIQSNIASKKQTLSKFSSLLQVLGQKISIPLPALAALALVVFGFALLTLTQNNSGSTSIDSVASNRLELPRDLGGIDSFRSSFVSSDTIDQNKESNQDNAVQVTFEVQNISELLSLLEGNGEIRELSIKLPQLRSIPKSREPVLLHYSDLINASYTSASSGVRP